MDELSPEEVVDAFRAYLAERAAAGVSAAQAVSGIRYDHRTVTVEFDADVAGFDREALLTSLPFDNWAAFAGGPILFDNPESNRLRDGVDRVVTVLVDGRAMGTLSASELYKAGTGRELAP